MIMHELKTLEQGPLVGGSFLPGWPGLVGMADVIMADVLDAVEAARELEDLLDDGRGVPQHIALRLTRMLATGTAIDIEVKGRSFVAKPSAELLALLGHDARDDPEALKLPPAWRLVALLLYRLGRGLVGWSWAGG